MYAQQNTTIYFIQQCGTWSKMFEATLVGVALKDDMHTARPEPRPFKHLSDVCLKCYDGVGLLFKKTVDYQSTRHQTIPYQLWVWLSGWLLGDFRLVCCVQLGFKFMLPSSGFSFNWYTRGIPGQPDIEKTELTDFYSCRKDRKSIFLQNL